MTKPKRKKARVKIEPAMVAHVVAEIEPAAEIDLTVEAATNEPVVLVALPKKTWQEKVMGFLGITN